MSENLFSTSWIRLWISFFRTILIIKPLSLSSKLGKTAGDTPDCIFSGSSANSDSESLNFLFRYFSNLLFSELAHYSITFRLREDFILLVSALGESLDSTRMGFSSTEP